MLPPGVSVCPRDGARAVAENPFVDEATVRRDSSGPPRGTGKAPAAGTAQPLLTPAPAEPADEAEEEQAWEATVSRDLMVGKQLGDFIVKRRIGAGGMGIVYEGEHPIIGRKVAIKILRPEFSDGGGARDLIAEARAASAIRHRGIIDVFGFGTIPHIGQYLVMEYLEGSPLDEVIAQRAPMLEAEVIALLDELLAALGAAHAMGVTHRDLKPGNIFVVRDSGGGESVKVLDFGLAKRSEVPHGTSPQTRASMIVGTPEYMAPEQATGQSVGPHTDLYSVGVIAFEMLTRRIPFEGASAMAIAIQHVQAPAPAPSKYVDLHPALNALVVRLLAKTAAERPASADAVRRELKAISKQLSDGATRLEPSPKGAPRTELEMPSLGTGEHPALSGNAPRPRNSRPAPETLTAPGAPPADTSRLAPDTTQQAAIRPERGSPLSTEKIAAVRPSRLPQFVVGGLVLLALAGLGIWSLRQGSTPGPEQPPVAETPPHPVNTNPPPTVAEVKPVTPPEPGSSVDTSQKNPNTDPQTPVGSLPTNPTVQPSTPVKPKNTETGTGKLYLVVHGTWANIIVDGKQVGQVPPFAEVDVPAGKRMLELANPRLQTFKKPVIIVAGKRKRIEVSLDPTAGALVEDQ
jgi:serine/threonine protein kinase